MADIAGLMLYYIVGLFGNVVTNFMTIGHNIRYGMQIETEDSRCKFFSSISNCLTNKNMTECLMEI